MCIVIVLHHSAFLATPDTQMMFPLGSLAADFFFMLTGYFAYAHFVRNEKSEEANRENIMKYWMSYTLKKLKKVLPYCVISILGIYILEFFCRSEGLPLVDRIMRLQNLPFELTLTPMLGIIPLDFGNYRNSSLWFLSAMMITLPLLLYLIEKYKDFMTSYVIWFLPGIIQAWFLVNYGGICVWGTYSGLLYLGVVRAFSDMMMGCAIYLAARALERKMENAKGIIRLCFTITELLLLLLTFKQFTRALSGADQIFSLYVMAAMLIIATSGISHTSKISGSAFDFLGQLSMPIYCIHWTVYQYVACFLRPGYYKGIICILVICIALSAFLISVISRIQRRQISK